jgi:hypothetical protein
MFSSFFSHFFSFSSYMITTLYAVEGLDDHTTMTYLHFLGQLNYTRRWRVPVLEPFQRWRYQASSTPMWFKLNLDLCCWSNYGPFFSFFFATHSILVDMWPFILFYFRFRLGTCKFVLLDCWRSKFTNFYNC